MAYIFNFKDAMNYEQWVQNPRNRLAMDREQRLTLEMLSPVRGRRLLDIGCGSGIRLSPLIEQGLDVTGLDPSPYMIDMGKERFKNRVAFHRGCGESLPFEDNSFHYVTLITALEYVQDPAKVIEEAARVAKDKIFIGVYNRYAFKCIEMRVRGIFSETVFNRAQFFSIWQLKRMVKKALGNVPVAYKTISCFSTMRFPYGNALHLSDLADKYPFGGFVGILITPVPRFITKPLVLRYKAPSAIQSRVQPFRGSKSREM